MGLHRSRLGPEASVVSADRQRPRASEATAALFDALAQSLLGQPTKLVRDAGSGTRRMVLMLTDRASTTTAARRCPARRRACRTTSAIDYGVGSAKKPPRISLLPKVAGQ